MLNKGIAFNKLKKHYFFAVFLFCFTSFNLFSQCPTVANPIQTFCNSQSPKISNLVATSSSGLVWYATATSTTPLSNTLALVDGEDYFADNSSGTCGTRQKVVVTIYTAPIGLNFQGVCVDNASDATIANLIAIGNNVKWYDVPVGGTALPSSTVLLDNKIYYASQTNPNTGCETSRLSVFVNVALIPVPTGSSLQEFCNDPSNPPRVSDLAASGDNFWYSSQFSSEPLDPNTPLVDGQSYFATTFDPPCESTSRFEVVVKLYPLNNTGISATYSVCQNTSGTINLFSLLTGGPDTNGIWTGPFATTNGNLGTLNLSNLILSGSPYVFTYQVSSTVCPTQTATVTITITPAPKAGDNAILKICTNDFSNKDLFALLGTDAQTGGTWTPALASGTNIYNPSLDLSNSYTYKVTGTPPCLDSKAIVRIDKIQEPKAGTDGSLTLCSNGIVTDLFQSLGGSPDAGGTWSPALASGTGMFDPKVDAAGTYTYTVKGTVPCSDDSSTVVVSITPAPDPGTDGSLELCLNSVPQDLFLQLKGSPNAGGTWSPALVSGTGIFDPAIDKAGIYTYSVKGVSPCSDASSKVTVTVKPVPDAGEDWNLEICSNSLPIDLFKTLRGTPQVGGSWSPALASGSGMFDPKVDVAGNYTYTVGGGLCSTDTAVITVVVKKSPNAGGTGATLKLNVCFKETNVDLFKGLNGTQDVGKWTDDDATNALTDNVFNPSLVGAGTYRFTYTVVDLTSVCNLDKATVVVVVSPLPDAGKFKNIEKLCNSSSNFDLLTLLDNEQTGGKFYDKNDLEVVNPLDLKNLTEGLNEYKYVVENVCGKDFEIVQIDILPKPKLEISNIRATTPICLGQSQSVSISGLADGKYTLVYAMTGSNLLASQTINISVVSGVANFEINKSNILKTGTTTIVFEKITNVLTGCSNTLTAVTIDFEVKPIADIDVSNLKIDDICFGTDSIVLITNAINLPDGEYEFVYDLLELNLLNQSSGKILIKSGTGQFTIPKALLTRAGVFTIKIKTIKSITNGCDNNNKDLQTTFKVLDIPNIDGIVISVNKSCINNSNQVLVTNATNLSDGTYVFTYELTGDNRSQAIVNVVITNGKGSFEIPSTVLTNKGTVTLTIVDIKPLISKCGIIGSAIKPVTFEVVMIDEPVLVPSGNEFCNLDNPIILNLSAKTTGANLIVWYDAPTGGNAYNNTDLLIDGTTYYGASKSDIGCESITRLAVTVDLTKCDEVLIPDGFSPNGDGTNDTFEIKHLPISYPNYTIEIYDRYGSVLYNGNKNKPFWDGTSSNGKLNFGNGILPAGVYFYIIEFNDGKKKPVQGRVYLSR